MRSLAAEALDHQMELASFYSTEHGQRAARSAAIACVQDDDLPAWRAERVEAEAARNGIITHRSVTVAGETFAIDADILTILSAAAKDMPSYRLNTLDLPCSIGFIWFETPTVIHDVNDQPLVVRAIGWQGVTVRQDDGSTKDGIFLLSWTDPFDTRDHLSEEWATSMTERMEEAIAKGDFTFPPMRLWTLPSTWMYGVESQDGVCSFLAAFFRFIDQTFVATTPTHPDRATARRAKRQKLNDSVKIVHLRRRETARRDGDEEHGGREYDHRWLVRGHWRNQWYPSLSDHRPIWIHEHIKGPEEMPLVVKDTIFLVDR